MNGECMSNQIVPFTNPEFGTIRTILGNDHEPWFVAKDVCAALEIKNVTDALKNLDSDERMTLDNSEGHSGQRGGAQSMNIISEAGLYSLILRSRKPEAKALFADAVAASDGTCLVGELAKMLRQNGVQVGQNRLFEILRKDGFLGKTGSNRNVPTQRAMDLGLFRIKETAVTHSDGHVTISRTPKVTGKGQRYFVERYGRYTNAGVGD